MENIKQYYKKHKKIPLADLELFLDKIKNDSENLISDISYISSSYKRENILSELSQMIELKKEQLLIDVSSVYDVI